MRIALILVEGKGFQPHSLILENKMFVSSNLLRLFQDTGRFRERLEERGRGVEAPWAESGTQEIKMPD